MSQYQGHTITQPLCLITSVNAAVSWRSFAVRLRNCLTFLILKTYKVRVTRCVFVFSSHLSTISSLNTEMTSWTGNDGEMYKLISSEVKKVSWFVDCIIHTRDCEADINTHWLWSGVSLNFIQMSCEAWKQPPIIPLRLKPEEETSVTAAEI